MGFHAVVCQFAITHRLGAIKIVLLRNKEFVFVSLQCSLVTSTAHDRVIIHTFFAPRERATLTIKQEHILYNLSGVGHQHDCSTSSSPAGLPRHQQIGFLKTSQWAKFVIL